MTYEDHRCKVLGNGPERRPYFASRNPPDFEGKKGSVLGIVTKTYSPPVNTGLSGREKGSVDGETGEVIQAENAPDFRARRFALKSVANSILIDSRTSKCMRFRAPNPLGGLSDVEIMKGENVGKAFYHGLLTCGSVWNCPVCSGKISERRRVELKQAMAQAELLGWRVHFVTLTVPHGIGDDLFQLLDSLQKCLSKLSQGKYSVNSQLNKYSSGLTIEGFIRAFEVTHGQNGFHPHYHLLVFTDADCTSSMLQYVYERAWKRACRLSGLPEPNHHGCTAEDGSRASEYVTKWGLEDEMTKANSKVASNKGKTPFGFLQAILAGDDLEYPAERSRGLFALYSKAFKGRRQLYWSNGLRKKLALAKELTDEELVALPDDDRAVLLASLSVEQWRLVLRHKQEANLLAIAEANPLAIEPFILNLS